MSELRHIREWDEDIGDAIWYRIPINEPPVVTSPLSSDWNDSYTHFQELPKITEDDHERVMDEYFKSNLVYRLHEICKILLPYSTPKSNLVIGQNKLYLNTGKATPEEMSELSLRKLATLGCTWGVTQNCWKIRQ